MHLAETQGKRTLNLYNAQTVDKVVLGLLS